MNPVSPAIVLIDPQLGENIGMAARAMLNCGLTDLRLVRPRDGWPSQSAERAASGALEKGVMTTLFDTTESAVANCHFVLGTTARPRDMIKDVYTASTAAKTLNQATLDRKKTAILFGAERSGLQNEDIARTNGIITMPLNPDFTSLNLSQAVLLVSYEWMITHQEMPVDPVTVTGKTDSATHHDLSIFTHRLIAELSAHSFFRSDQLRPTIERNLINMVSRMNLTQQDTQTLHGIVSALISRNND